MGPSYLGKSKYEGREQDQMLLYSYRPLIHKRSRLGTPTRSGPAITDTYLRSVIASQHSYTSNTLLQTNEVTGYSALKSLHYCTLSLIDNIDMFQSQGLAVESGPNLAVHSGSGSAASFLLRSSVEIYATPVELTVGQRISQVSRLHSC